MRTQSPHNNPTIAAASNQEAGHHLAVATAGEAGNYGVNYVKERVNDSVVLEILRNGACPEDLKKQQRIMQQSAGTFGKAMNSFTSEDFIELTNAVKLYAIGNCADLCMLAARAIVENGYPHTVELCGISGELNDYFLDHAFLSIHCDPQNENARSHVIDPLVELLSPSDQSHFLGAVQPKTFEQQHSYRHLFCYAIHQITGAAQFVSLADISNLEILSIGTFSYTPDSQLQFNPSTS
ncbi:hypothetical protein ACXX82_24555 [Glaciimonas sp. GNP009]